MCEIDTVHLPVKLSGDPSVSRGVAAGGYLVDVANDGVKYSNKQGLYIVYDSKCVECHGGKTGVCSHKVSQKYLKGNIHFIFALLPRRYWETNL